MTRSLLLAALTASLTAAANAQSFQVVPNDPWCQEDDGRERRPGWCEVRELQAAAAAGVLAVDASPNGAVVATGWDRHEVRVRVKVKAQADTEADARQLVSEVSLATAPPYRATGPANQRGTWWSASFDVTVPERSDLKLSTVNGPIGVSGVEGRLALETQNGPLSVSDAAGSVHGRTSNGPVSVKLSGSEWKGEGLDVETTNGPVTLSIPEGYDARLETGTVNGPVNLGFPLTISGDVKRDIRTTLGKGGALVRVRTTNGPLNVRRP